MRLLRIEAPHFVAGIVLDKGTVIEAAPILRYMLRWDAQRVQKFCAKKHWRASVTPCARGPNG